MDAKSKAKFINSVTSGGTVICPKCGTSNKADNRFCESCEEKLEEKQSDSSPTVTAKTVDEPKQVVKTEEHIDAFALGLPEWSIEPPMVVVRRR